MRKLTKKRTPRRRLLKRGLIGGVLLLVAGVAVACAAFGGRGLTMDLIGSDHWKDGKFHNHIREVDPLERDGMISTMWSFMFENRSLRSPAEPPSVADLSGADYDRPPASGLRVTWLGHSTSLIEIDGQRVLTDPIWSNRASPVGFVGPERFFDPPLPLDQLPDLDVIVISHDHLDHLDRKTIEALHERVPVFVVPLGVGGHLRDWGVPSDRIRELDWWQDTTVGDLRLVCAPSRHFSGRGLFDRNRTLWASWAIIGPQHRAYFSGDGGMSSVFSEIGERLGPFDVTLMEIGAYHSAWADIHNGPEQAVQAHLDLRGAVMLPIHWGTFNLSLHAWTEPAERVMVAARQRGVTLALPRPGEPFEPASPPRVHRWWPEQSWQTADEAPIVSPEASVLAEVSL